MDEGVAGQLVGAREQAKAEASPNVLSSRSSSRQDCASAPLGALAERIRTGCVYEWQPVGTFGLLVTRDDPRTRWRARPVLAPIDAHWALFAPSVYLLTGHATACRARRCRGVGRCAGRTPLSLGWPDFAVAYRAELEQRTLPSRLAVVYQILEWLRTYRTVTVLSFESGMPHGEALVAWEQRGELVPWAQRHIFHDWAVSLLPVVGRVAA